MCSVDLPYSDPVEKVDFCIQYKEFLETETSPLLLIDDRTRYRRETFLSSLLLSDDRTKTRVTRYFQPWVESVPELELPTDVIGNTDWWWW